MIDFATIILGSITTCLSVFLMFYFARLKSSLARPLAVMLFGEAIYGSLSTAFSVAAVVGNGDVSAAWSLEFQTLVRWVMFITAGATSLHLALKVREISGLDGES